MIKKLRTKFITIATGAVFLMLLLVLGIINIITSVRNRQEAGLLLNYIAQNDGYIPSSRNHETFKGDLETVLTPETQFETRYFSVHLDGDRVVDVNIDHVAAISYDDACRYAQKVAKSGKNRGNLFRNGRSYDHLQVDKGSGKKLLVVLDTTRMYRVTASTIRFSTYVGIVMIGIFFVIISVMSRRVLKPIIDNIESQRQFITNASHELKTPIAIISANTEVLEMTTGQSEWTQSIRNQTQRLTGLINRLITLARLQEYGQMTLSDINASVIVQSVASSFQPLMERQGCSYTYNVEEDVHIFAEENTVHELVSILLDNAAKYCDPGGNVSLELNKKGKSMLLSVSNSYAEGEGVDYSRFFDRFYREDQSHNSEKKGYGIGLSVAAEMVAGFRGRIYVTYKDGMISFIVNI